jgi:uncharacterized protein YbjT (DUF2867 family)
MNVTVFGATGAIGSLTVNELLTNGHTVTAYARNPNKIPPEWGDQVRVIIGELSDADAIDRAVQGADVVVSALGPSLDRKATGMPLIDGTRHILDAMKRHGVSRSSASPRSDHRSSKVEPCRLSATGDGRKAHQREGHGHTHGHTSRLQGRRIRHRG